jgi:formylglycine-generating enzyme required for sulfatase activity
VLGAVIAALMIGAVMIALSGLLSGGDDDPNDGKETPQTQAVGVERSETPEPTLDIALIVQTLDAQATLDGATLNAQATVAARATNYAGGTQSAQNQTATATLWTFTPTPNITASIEAYRTQQAGDQTATATLWTATFTPTETLTPTLTATVTPAPTHTPTATPEPLEAALMRARNFSGGNADWEPLVQTFDGVEMVLVPAGCFEMGSTQYDDEKPPHRVCFDEPYWMDRTEVTNGQFATLNGQAVKSSYFSGDERPREQITWTEASAFCESRGARLPTEAEWEYAARGPEAWEYPWGDGFDGSKVVWNRSESDGTAPVGSLPAGASWVGALDMSGNVWEWVADWYGESYYASLENGVSNPTGPTSGEYRVLRGGSWWYNITYNLRAASRNWASPGYWNINIGFRCARSAAG